MQIAIDDELIEQSVKQSIKKLGLVPEETLKGKTWDIEEFRKQCLGGKGRAWVKREIYAYDDSLWVNDHYREFNWG